MRSMIIGYELQNDCCWDDIDSAPWEDDDEL